MCLCRPCSSHSSRGTGQTRGQAGDILARSASVVASVSGDKVLLIFPDIFSEVEVPCPIVNELFSCDHLHHVEDEVETQHVSSQVHLLLDAMPLVGEVEFLSMTCGSFGPHVDSCGLRVVPDPGDLEQVGERRSFHWASPCVYPLMDIWLQ